YNIANSRLTGAGYEYYGSWLYLANAPNPEAVHSSHSIYFQALGEHGWVGFLIYVTFLLTFWLKCRQIVRLSPDTTDGHADQAMARMFQVSLIGFMVAGAFVNIGNWDAIYYAFIVVLALNRLREEEARVTKSAEASRRRILRRESQQDSAGQLQGGQV